MTITWKQDKDKLIKITTTEEVFSISKLQDEVAVLNSQLTDIKDLEESPVDTKELASAKKFHNEQQEYFRNKIQQELYYKNKILSNVPKDISEVTK